MSKKFLFCSAEMLKYELSLIFHFIRAALKGTYLLVITNESKQLNCFLKAVDKIKIIGHFKKVILPFMNLADQSSWFILSPKVI